MITKQDVQGWIDALSQNKAKVTHAMLSSKSSLNNSFVKNYNLVGRLTKTKRIKFILT